MNKLLVQLTPLLALAVVAACVAAIPVPSPDDVIPVGTRGLTIRRRHLSDETIAAMKKAALGDENMSHAADAGAGSEIHANAVGARPPVLNYWWTQPLVLDMSNVSTHASDNNNCTSTSTPCLTKAEWVARMNESPGPWRIQSNLTYVNMSSEIGSFDPISFDPLRCEGGSILVQGSLTAATATTLCSGTLTSGGTATNRSANTLPAVNGLPAGCAGVNFSTLMDNSTIHSRTWCNSGVSGLACTTTQPLASASTVGFPIATTSMSLNEVSASTWVSTNSVAMYKLPSFNISSMDPTLEQTAGSSNSCLYLNQITLYDPNGINGSTNTVRVGNNVTAYEIEVDAAIQLTGTSDFLDSGCVNCYGNGVLTGGRPQAGSAFWRWVGGATEGSIAMAGPGVAFTGDVEIDNSATFAGGVSLELVNNHSGSVIALVNGGNSVLAPLVHGYAIDFLWGGGGFHVNQNSRFSYDPVDGGGTAATTIFQTLKFNNNQTTGCNVVAGSPVVTTSGVTLTTAHLDAATPAGFNGFATSCTVGPAVITSNLN